MTGPEACPQCGARPRTAGALNCEYCGTLLVDGAPPPSPHGDLRRRFQRLEQHPDLPQLLRHEPPTKRESTTRALNVVFAIVFVVIPLVMAGFFAITVVGLPLSIFPLAVAALGIWLLRKALRRQRRFRDAPLLRVPRLVVDERTHVSGGHQSSPARTRYYVTLQAPDGSRTEQRVHASLAGRMSQGDMGLAYIKDDLLLAFARLEV
jgi:hypothetical protein